MDKLKGFFDKDIELSGIKKSRVFPFAVAAVLTFAMLVDTHILHGKLISWTFEFGASIVGFILLWMFMKASFTVLKTFFLLSAELSLFLYLAQSYCASKIRGADGALSVLVTLSVLYIIYEFAQTIKDAWVDRFRELPAAERTWKKTTVTVLYVLFSLMFMSIIYQVVRPIILGLCIYR